MKIAFKPGVMGFSTQTIQEADATTDRSAEALARKVDNSGVTKFSHRMCGSWFKLTDLAPDGKLHIIGHGVPVQNNKGLVTHAESMSGYSMIEIANILINDLGLPADFNGQIVLHSCYSGLGSDNQESLAVQLQNRLAAKNRKVTVKALLGRGIIRDTSSVDQLRDRFDPQAVTGQMTVQTAENGFRLAECRAEL